MKCIITGSKTVQSFKAVTDAMTLSTFNPTVIFTDMSPGPPIFGYRWARERNLPVRTFQVEWDKYGKPAGVITMREMIAFCDALVVVSDGTDFVSQHAVKYARQQDPKVLIFSVVFKPETQTLVEYGRNESKNGSLLSQ